ncbi:NAD(P)-dependent oxidoreductase [uncultured Acetobacteroides sp.]|uniref:NAD(P)-dependent oxidoreductase n=1 Tax=uncultured Acetobacteroides sp. TaxID=1760811 RepID=UPI0029F49FA6|nr:NAD(P)-dependent oxidoreductase [uncultured Acetobacteroides sp.]
MAKVLVATEKPFAKEAVDGIRKIVEGAGFELALLEKYTSNDELLKAVADADGLIVRSDKVTREVVEAAKNLKVVVRAGAGYDNLDLAACTEKGVVAMNTPGQNSNAVGELAFGMMVYIARNSFQPGTGAELKGKKIGIHAYGNVGRCVATIAKGFGMEVYAFDPFVSAEAMAAEGIKVCSTVEELYATCNYVSLHIPANDKTKNSINFDLLSKMPNGGVLVNTARKEVIHEAELVKMMAERPDFKYVSDIEPGNAAELKEKFGNRVFFTPKKMGAETAEANVNAGLAAARQVVGLIKNGDKTYQVNK